MCLYNTSRKFRLICKRSREKNGIGSVESGPQMRWDFFLSLLGESTWNGDGWMDWRIDGYWIIIEFLWSGSFQTLGSLGECGPWGCSGLLYSVSFDNTGQHSARVKGPFKRRMTRAKASRGGTRNAGLEVEMIGFKTCWILRTLDSGWSASRSKAARGSCWFIVVLMGSRV